MNKKYFSLTILPLVAALVVGHLSHAAAFQKRVGQVVPVEIFQVYELPVSISRVELVSSARAYELRCSITNNSNEKLHGFRYSLVATDSNDGRHALVNRSEAFVLLPYETRQRTIRTPLNIKLKAEYRLVIMFEQILGADSIWEVIKPKDALEAYLSGDYSVIPRVLRVANQVDAPAVVPLRLRIPY
ncbi:MAG TPA: hypothetical protein VF074_02585 [Pyrinomonadaceae bacterium]